MWLIADAEAWVGELMFGKDWFPPWALPNRWIIPPLGSSADNLSARTLAVEYLDYRRNFDRHFLVHAEEYGLRPPLLVRDENDTSAADFSEGPDDADKNMKLVRIAVPDRQYRAALRLNADVANHWQRVAQVRESLVRNFASGAIQTFVRPEHGGQLVPFDAGNWHLEYWDPRFDTRRVDLSEPFPPRPVEADLRPDEDLGRWLGKLYMGPIRPAHPPSNGHWIFVDIESLYRAYNVPMKTGSDGNPPPDLPGFQPEDIALPGLPYPTLQEAVSAALKATPAQADTTRRALKAIQVLGWTAWPTESSKKIYPKIRSKMGLQKGENVSDTLRRMVLAYRLNEYRE